MTQLKPFESSEYLTNEDTIVNSSLPRLKTQTLTCSCAPCKKSPRPVVCRSWPVMQA